MFIRTPRLFLRPPFPEDRVLLGQALAGEPAARTLASVPRRGDEQSTGPDVRAHYPRFLITVPADPGAPVIGEVALEEHAGEPELRCFIASERRGQGYATEAGRAVIEIARALGHRRILACHSIGDSTSVRLLVKLGFQRTGDVRPLSWGGGRLVLTRRHALELTESAAKIIDAPMRAA